MQNLFGVTILTVSVLVTLWVARLILTVAVAGLRRRLPAPRSETYLS